MSTFVDELVPTVTQPQLLAITGWIKFQTGWSSLDDSVVWWSLASFLVLRLIGTFFVLMFPPIVKPEDAKKHEKNRKVRATASQIVVSTWHALAITAVSVWVLVARPESPIFEDHLFGEDRLVSQSITFTLAYFFFDLVDAFLSGNMDPAMVVHHFCGLVGFGMNVRPFAHYHGMLFILWEASTPLMNARWILLRYGWTKTLIFRLVSYAFFVVFFVVRILFGFRNTGVMVGDVWPVLSTAWQSGVWSQTPILCALTLAMVLVGNALCAFWFSQMVSGLRKLLADNTSKPKTQ